MNIVNVAAAALLVVLAFYLLNLGQALLLPLVIAIAVWFLINSLALGIQRLRIAGWQLPMPLCLLAAIGTFGLLAWGLVEYFSGRVSEVMVVLPEYQANLIARLQSLPFVDVSQLREQGLVQVVTDWINLPSLATSLASSFASVIASGGLILIYILFLFLEQGQIRAKVTALAGEPRDGGNLNRMLDQVRDDIQKYISIKMFTSTLTGLLSYGFLKLAGVDFAGVWGLLIFLLNFIPTVGSIVATGFPAMIALAQSEGYALLLSVLVGIGGVQVCVGNILEPRLLGGSFNLSPIIILFNLALWGYLWGIPGMFLCVPFLIIGTIILGHFPRTRPIAVLLSRDGRLPALGGDNTPAASGDPATQAAGLGGDNTPAASGGPATQAAGLGGDNGHDMR